MKRLVIATCLALPEVDPDAPLLHDALVARGVEPVLRAWDDPSARFDDVDRCVIRSTWNYWLPGNFERFLSWVERTASTTRLSNPAPVVRWNLHKRYLVELASRGVPVVPTELCPRGDTRPLRDVMRALGAERAVIKPAVSAGSYQTMKVDEANLDEGERHLRLVVAGADVLVQPYVASVEGWGERALVWIDGELMHAVRKSPRFGGEHESVSPALAIEPDERALAERTLAQVAQLTQTDEPLLYARIDMARDDQGAPRLMELELVEPSLFLRQSPAALARLADAMAR